MSSTSAADFQAQLDACAAQVASVNRAIDGYRSQVTAYTNLANLAAALKVRLVKAGYGQNFTNVRPFYVAIPGFGDIYNDSGYMTRSRKRTGSLATVKCYTQSLNLGPQYNPPVYAAALRSMLASNTTWASNDPFPLTVNDIYYVDIRTGKDTCLGSSDVTAYCYKTAQRINWENLQMSNADADKRTNDANATTLLPQVPNITCSICQNVNASTCDGGATCITEQSNSCGDRAKDAQAALDACNQKGGKLDDRQKCILPAAAPSAQVLNTVPPKTPATTPPPKKETPKIEDKKPVRNDKMIALYVTLGIIALAGIAFAMKTYKSKAKEVAVAAA